MKKKYTKKQIQEAIDYWTKQLKLGNYKQYQVEQIIKESTKDEIQVLRVLRIPDGVDGIEDYQFQGRNDFEAVELPKTISSIGNYAFDECKKLKEIRLPHGVQIIGYQAFSGCSNLERVIIPSSVKVIKHEAFHGCHHIKEVLFVRRTEDQVKSIPDDYHRDAGMSWPWGLDSKVIKCEP